MRGLPLWAIIESTPLPPGAETPPATQTNRLYFVHRHKEGMLRARQGDRETEQVVQSVAEGMLTITDTRGQDAVEDWEVDELLEWTNGLNFDQYVKTLFFTAVFGLSGGYSNFSKTPSNTNICQCF